MLHGGTRETAEDAFDQVDDSTETGYVDGANYGDGCYARALDPGQSPNADALLSKAQKAMRKGTSVYTTASTAAADLHVIRYLSDKKDPQCWPE